MTKFLAASLMVAFGAFASADSVYFVSDSNNHELYQMDLGTMAVTAVGSLGIDGNSATFGDLTYDSKTGTMYYSGGRGDENLYTVNLSTGAATLVGPNNQPDMFALGYDGANGGLYGATAGGNFGSVDMNTGAYSQIASNGLYNEGLTYNSATNQMILETLGQTYSVDVVTGAATLIGNIVDSGGNSIFINDNGITYDANRNVYWDYDYSLNLREINASTLTVMNTFDMSAYGNGSSIAYVPAAVPEPATMTLLGLGAAAILRRRRARN